MRLILFDIDGTLLDAKGAGARALMIALAEVYGRPFARNGVRYAGRTDRAIVSDLILANGIGSAQVEPGLLGVWAVLPRIMEEETAKTPSVACPGVPALLDALFGEHLLGLVTGNMQPTAAIKLSSAGIEPSRFRVGAFGDESLERNDLPPLAIRRAVELTGMQVSTAVVVGDTPADVECAQTHGLRSVAVATGPFSLDELAVFRPDALFPDLADLVAVLRALTE